MTIPEIIHTLEAYQRGELLEVKCTNAFGQELWRPLIIEGLILDFTKYHYRIAPRTKKRIIHIDDLPHFFWVSRGLDRPWHLCTGVSAANDAIEIDGVWVSYADVAKDSMSAWSPDRTHRESFYVGSPV